MVASKEVKYFANSNVIFAALIANLTATAATCVMSWSSTALPMITRPGAKIFVTKKEGTLLSSIAALGAFFGPFVTGRLADKFGRKTTLLGGMLVLIITWGFFYVCDVLVILLCVRFVAGMCAGCVYGTLPMYISEISPVHLRGPLGSLLQFFDCIGYLVEILGGSCLSYENLSLLSACVPLLCFMLFMWIPESPYHLQNCGKEKESLKALQFFRNSAETADLKKEIQEMKLSAKTLKEAGGSIWSLFETESNLKCVYYAAALLTFQQCTGINVMTFYSKSVFIEAGRFLPPDTSALIFNMVMLVASVVIVPASGFFKLRSLLFFSSIGITISMFFIGGFFYLQETHSDITGSLAWVPLFSLSVFIVFYILGWGPIIWCITSVIFPANLKAIACGMCASYMWFTTFLLTSIFPFVDPAIGFSIFGCITFVSWFFVRFQLPETQGKTFQEIQDIIQKK